MTFLRNTFLFACALFGCTYTSSSPVSALYGPQSPVKLLNAQQFKDQVINSHDLFLVEFFASWCGHCKALAPEFEKAAKALRGIATLVAVEDQSVVSEFDVKGFPTLKVLVGKGGKTPKVFEYQGPRDANGLMEFVLTHVGKLARARLSGKIDAGKSKPSDSRGDSPPKKPAHSGPSDVIELTDSNFDKLVMSDDKSVWFIEFYAPWCGHCKSLAPVWEEVATSLKGKVKVGKVDATAEKMIGQRFKIQGFPTLKLFPSGEKSISTVIDYEGPRMADDLMKYGMDFFSANAEAEQLLDNSVFEEACGSQLCVVSFLPHILDSKAEKRREYIDMFNQVVRSSIKMPIAFFWTQGGDQFEFEEQLNLAFGYPAVVAIHKSKQKFATHRGDFSKESINTFLQQLLAGKAPVSSLPALKPLAKSEKWNGKDAAKPLEEEL